MSGIAARAGGKHDVRRMRTAYPVSQYARPTTTYLFFVGLDAELRTSALPSGSRWRTCSTTDAVNRIRLSYVGDVRPMDSSAGGKRRSDDPRRTCGCETRSSGR